MEKALGVVIFTAIVIVLVAIIVFSQGNSPAPQGQMTANQTSQNSSLLNSTSQNSTVSLQQLAEHDSKSDCWVGYNESAYDLTQWLPKHPGSSGAIEPYCGTAAEFEAAFKGQHGASQVKTLLRESVYKGELR